MKIMNKPIHYRFVNEFSYGGETIRCLKYRVVSETPKGYWISLCPEMLQVYGKKWVSKSSVKRFAYPNKKEALNSFLSRKLRQHQLLTHQLERCEAAMKGAKRIDIAVLQAENFTPITVYVDKEKTYV